MQKYSVNPFPDLKVRWMFVSPERASEWLKGNTRNRTRREKWIAQYCHDIATGKWGLSESCVVIAANGVILNGQHRLEAIVASQEGLWQVVVTGVPADAIFDMDQGKRRSFVDAYNLRHASNGRHIQNRDAAMATTAFIYNAFTAEPMVSPTHHDKAGLFRRHGEALAWTSEAFGNGTIRGVTVGPVMGPVARAYYGCKNDGRLTRLREFVDVMVTGESKRPEDQAAVKLRNFAMLADAGGQRTVPRHELYRKTERALVAFLAEERIERLFPIDAEAFAVPNE